MTTEAWAIIGSIVGIVIGASLTGIASWMTNSKRINADLKAKTRLEWIREVREITAEIIRDMHTLLILVDKYKEFGSKNNGLTEEEILQFKVESSAIESEIFKNLNLYKLYFSTITKKGWGYKKQKENIDMHSYAEAVNTQMLNLNAEVLHNRGNLYDPRVITEFRDNTSDYLKREWDKAKKNK